MISLAYSAASLLLAAVLLALTELLPPAGVAHVAFALAALPLIFGAIQHFVPVLTRSGAPGRMLSLLPWAAQAAGVLAVGAIAGWWPRQILLFAASLVVLAVLAMLGWISARVRCCLGSPHPGWRWYGAALAMLLLAMLAVPFIDSAWGWPARLFHLHVNLLGLIGMAAMGTLPVLLPTVLGQSDPAAAMWLRRWFWPLSIAVLLVAAGQALAAQDRRFACLAVVGSGLLLLGMGRLLAAWGNRFGAALWRDGAAASLLTALLGLMGVLLLLCCHAVAQALKFNGAAPLLSSGSLAIPAFVVVFLLPLVSGTLSHLLPVLRYPLNLPQRQGWRRQLVAGGHRRAISWMVAGLCLALAGVCSTARPCLLPAAGGISVLALLDFVFALRPCKPER